ncbi:MAG: GDSL-type esterase/lipase family protein [Bacteroides sp.]|nr:GDSL-type esterase/lipase family protein [Bacteroides sp.]
MKIIPNSEQFLYTGRIDLSDPKKPLLTYAGCAAETEFTGNRIGVYLINEAMYEYCSVGVIVDGIQYKFELKESDEEIYIEVPVRDERDIHTLTVFKRQAAAHYIRFCGIETEDGAEVSLPQRDYALNIEVFGDSVSAGELCEAVYYEGCCDYPEFKSAGIYDNSYFAYPQILGRKLNARVFDNAQGGIALLDKTGFFCGPDTEGLVGLETTYDKMSYVKYSREGYSDWDFSRFTPDLIIMAVGQNDHQPDPEVINDGEYMKKWKARYKEIISDLRRRYGKPVPVLMILTLLMHDPKWDKILDEIETELGDNEIRHYTFRRCGKATPGHPRITEQLEMATELELYIRDWFALS